MATTSGYDYGIRQGLVGKGVSNADIGYNPGTGYVTVKGQNAIKAPKVYNGTSFTTQQDFNTQWDQYNKAQQQPAQTGFQPTGMAGAGQQYTGMTSSGVSQPAAGYSQPQQYNPYTTAQTQNPYTQQADAVIQQLLNYGKQQAQNPYTSQADAVIQQLLNYNQNQPTFDPYSSSGYAAAQAQAQRAAQQGTRAAQEAYGSAGFGRSTGLGERVAGIQGDATEYLMTQVVPQLEAQEQARRQQEYNNIMSALSPIMNQQGRSDQLVQQEYNNQLSALQQLVGQQQFGEQQRQFNQQFAEQTAQGRAGLTGSFISPEAQQTINQLMGLKQQTEQNWMNMTPEQRNAARAQGDQLRAQLQGMQVDPSLFGAGVTSAQATQNIGRAGTPTLAGQAQQMAAQGQQFEQATTLRQLDRADFESDRQFEFAKGQQEWENNFQSGQFNWQKAQQAWENTFKEKDFLQQMKEAAASRGLQWASLKQRDKEFIADQKFREKQFEYEVEQDKLSQTGKVDYTTDPSYAEDIGWINSNPQNAVAEIRAQSTALIEQYGTKGYESLLKAAQDAASE